VEKPEAFNAYSNAVSIAFSTYDFRLEFGQKAPGSEPNSINPDELLGYITMSPQHFKAFVEAMNRTLKRYEEIFGPINLTPNDKAAEHTEADANR